MNDYVYERSAGGSPLMHPTARAILNSIRMEGDAAARVVLWLGMVAELGEEEAMRQLTEARSMVVLHLVERMEYLYLLELVNHDAAAKAAY